MDFVSPAFGREMKTETKVNRFAIAAPLSLSAAPIMAEPECTPADAVKPVRDVMKAIEAAGGTVVAFKISDGGCPAIHGTVDGRNHGVFDDRNTGLELEPIEA